MIETSEASRVLDVGIDEKVPGRQLPLYAAQHLLALTGIFLFPVLIGQSLDLDAQQVGHIVQACFLMTGIVTILQSSRVLRLPIVQGPTAAFFAAIVAAGATFGLGTAFGSMIVAGAIYLLLTIPLGRFGLFGYLNRYVSSPVVIGTLLVIIGAQLASIGLPNWFGVPGLPGFGWHNFLIGVATAVTIVACMVFGGNGLAKRGAFLWGVTAGSALAAVTAAWGLPDLGAASFLGAPAFLPFGFGVAWPAVLLMLLAFLQAGSESMGMYNLIGGWGGQKLSQQRVNRGLFSEFLGTAVGAAFGGIGTTSYPENAGIVRVTRIGSRFVTMTAGALALAVAFLPQVALFIANLSGSVLAAASTILFGIIAVAGIQMLRDVDWDDLNVAVAGTAFIVSLGGQFLPEDILALFPADIRSLVTTPMMVGIVLLIVLHILVNHVVRPILVRRRAIPDPAATPAAAS